MENKIKNDEVDLVKLFLQGVNIFRANFWLITCFFLLGTALGFVHYYSSRKIYENKLVLSSAILTRSYGKILIDNLNQHRRESDLRTAADKLKISEDVIKEVAHIKIENLIEADGQKESDRYIITVEVFDEGILSELQKGLIHYLENNAFAKIRVEQNRKYFTQMIAKVEKEISDMEVFKERLFKGDLLKGNVMFDPTTVNSKIIELTKEKLTLQNGLDLVNSVQIVEGFTKFNRPSKPRLSVSIASGATIGLFFVAIIIAFKSIRKVLRLADNAKRAEQ
jgi:uncharacterized protein involved in exopolysaccharide biosynthesis